MSYCLSSLMFIHYHADFKSMSKQMQTIVASLIILMTLVVPVFLSCYLKKNIRKFRKKLFKKRFGSIIEHLNFREKWSSNYIWIFCYRRLAQVCLVVFLSEFYYA
jgi:hypothetical protein